MPVMLLFERDAEVMALARLVLRNFEVELPEGVGTAEGLFAIQDFCTAMGAEVFTAGLSAAEADVARALCARRFPDAPALGGATRRPAPAAASLPRAV